MDLLEIIKNRRSIRRYTEENVPDELIDKIIEAGIWAPSSKHCEPCEFIVIRDKEKREQLSKISPWSKFIADAPVAICILSNKSSSCVIMDGSAAVMNMLLEIHNLGLGSCWVNTKYNEKLVRDALNIPDKYEIITVIPVGYPAESPASQRKSIKDCTYKESYGNR